MKCYVNPKRKVGEIDRKIYGHFIEHFHRQIYGGVFDPSSPFADEDGFRKDVIDAMKNISVPILRWPGGCFVSSYNWKKGVGKNRVAYFDKSWRVEESNTFGTDEYVKLCRKIGCEPYICTNAGTGAAEEMSDWVEYCNLESEGEFAKWRINNGYKQPHNVKYWSIGNENYGYWEIGAKGAEEWGRLVAESAKMMLHVTPDLELSAAAMPDRNWNYHLLQSAGHNLKWLSIHSYWNFHPNNVYSPSDYATAMGYTANLGETIDNIRGTLMMFGLKNIKIAYDEWNLRAWYHPFTHQNLEQGKDPNVYLSARNKNDTNSTYTTADSVFSACFLNECIRNCDLVKMANFSPIINTSGAIFTHDKGIVKRSTYYVFEIMTKHMGDVAVDNWCEDSVCEVINGQKLKMIDLATAVNSSDGSVTISAVNKYDNKEQNLEIVLPNGTKTDKVKIYTVNGESTDSYNDVQKEEVKISTQTLSSKGETVNVILPPHSANVIVIS